MITITQKEIEDGRYSTVGHDFWWYCDVCKGFHPGETGVPMTCDNQKDENHDSEDTARH